ncbi:MAG TPA: efflux RND transporter permease subunit [Pirellulales bacterium]|jgi:multidrug efflux pump|nr:efflux RND transporter permease subunit [Pirellulales bacterium]
MLTRFFIDRPIFATVLSIAIALTGAIALFTLPIAQYPQITPPGVQVSIQYPGASAQVVADTVGAPIEQQVNGIDHMLYMSSQSGNDGSYSLTVTFDVGTDTNTALVMVQNRVQLAMQLLPTPVQNQGILIRKKTPDILMVVNFYSPKGLHDDVYLSNYATIHVKDELLRVEGVSDITYLGERDYSIRAWLDPQKLASLNMTASDVATAVLNQNRDAPAGQTGQPPASSKQALQLPISTLGRLTAPEQFGDIIIKSAVGQQPPPNSVTSPSSGGDYGLPNPTSTNPLPNPGIAVSSTVGGASTSGATLVANPAGGISSPIPAIIPSGTGGSGAAPSGGGASMVSGGAQSGGGASTAGGASSAGGASMAGGASTTASNSTASLASGLVLTNTTAGVSAAAGSGAGAATGPTAPTAALVRLRDVARVELGAQSYNQACTFDQHPSVGLAVWQLPGTNALDVANRVKARMEELKQRFPYDVDYDVGYDTTPFIRESIDDVIYTLLEAVALVGVVVLVFLQDWKAMILPMIDIPVSIIGTFAVMSALGFSLNNISLFGLVLAIGIVVDDAIVVLENIERMMARGHDPRTATLKAMEEVTGPIIAVGLVLCAVFVPCAFLSGITGLFFYQFAVTISVSTMISALNAVTMTPSRAVLIFTSKGAHGQGHTPTKEALPWWIFGFLGGLLSVWLARMFLADRFPGVRDIWAVELLVAFLPGLLVGGLVGWLVIRPVNVALGWVFRGFNRGFDWLTFGYGRTVGQSLHHSPSVLLAYGVLVLSTFWIFSRAPTGFIPQQDMGRFIVNVQLPDSASLQRTRDAVALVEKITHESPGVSHTVTVSGISFLASANSPNFASMFVVLKPFAERRTPELSDTGIMAQLRHEWRRRVLDAQVTAFPAAPLPGVGSAGGYKFMVEDRGGLGTSALQTQTDGLIQKLQARSGPLKNGTATTQFRSDTPQLFLDIDRAQVASLGVALNDVNQSLDIYLGSLYVTTFNEFGRHWQVNLQADRQYRDREADINLLQVRNNAGQMTMLGAMADVREIGGPISITRYNLYTAAAVNGTAPPNVSSGDAVRIIDRVADQTLPLAMNTEWTELMFLQIRAGNTTLIVFGLSILSVFLALAALYESWSLPLAVILVVPMCLLCSVAGVLFTHRDVNIFVQIGLVVLVGLACKNAILVVEYARQLHQEGQSVFAATVEASRLRLRPILMTSFAFVFGVLPLVFATGAGAEMRRSLGTAVFSGMLGVTVFGIFLTPVFFYVIVELGATRLFMAIAATGWLGSTALGGILGLAGGFLFAQLGIIALPWALLAGACAGLLAVLGVQLTRRRP